MEFIEFCKKVATGLGLEFCERSFTQRHATTYSATRTLPNPRFTVEFSDLSSHHPYYIAEIFEDKFYVGAIDYEVFNGNTSVEHYETSCSPIGKYNAENMPVNEECKEIDGELWVYFHGKQIAAACKSALKGGARAGRKPIKVY